MVQKYYILQKIKQRMLFIGKLNQVNTELIYLPDFGIKYFEALNEFNENI
jgi:hypothetical protein